MEYYERKILLRESLKFCSCTCAVNLLCEATFVLIDKHMLLHVQSFSWCLLIWQVTESAGLVRMNSASTMFPLTLGLSLVK